MFTTPTSFYIIRSGIDSMPGASGPINIPTKMLDNCVVTMEIFDIEA